MGKKIVMISCVITLLGVITGCAVAQKQQVKTTSELLQIELPQEKEGWTIGDTIDIKWQANVNDLPAEAVIRFSLLQVEPKDEGLRVGGSLGTAKVAGSSGTYSIVLPKKVAAGDVGSQLVPGQYEVFATLYDRMPCDFCAESTPKAMQLGQTRRIIITIR